MEAVYLFSLSITIISAMAIEREDDVTTIQPTPPTTPLEVEIIPLDMLCSLCHAVVNKLKRLQKENPAEFQKVKHCAALVSFITLEPGRELCEPKAIR